MRVLFSAEGYYDDTIIIAAIFKKKARRLQAQLFSHSASEVPEMI
jgi:hypothetical protein